MFRDKHVDGYIITPTEGVEEDINFLLYDNLPVVLFDRYFPDVDSNNVVVDNFSGTQNAIQHFIQQGEENIAFITLDSGQTQMTERMRGYGKALDSYNKKKYLLNILFIMMLKI